MSKFATVNIKFKLPVVYEWSKYRAVIRIHDNVRIERGLLLRACAGTLCFEVEKISIGADPLAPIESEDLVLDCKTIEFGSGGQPEYNKAVKLMVECGWECIDSSSKDYWRRKLSTS